jgi:hypothetical protein
VAAGPSSFAVPRRTPGGDASWPSGCRSHRCPTLEQRDVAEAAVGIALACGDQPRQQRRPHVGDVGRDRVGRARACAAAAEQLGVPCGMNDQVTASIMPRTASARLAARVRFCSVVRIGLIR